MSQPLVTVITPTYNRADYLPGVIDSVLAQTYEPIEYLVIDDGSQDHTREVLEGYTGRVDWEVQENMGETRTVNKGWGKATGDYVVIVNSDDPVMPELVAEAVAIMEADPQVLVAYPDWQMIDAEDKVIETMVTYDFDYANMVAWHHCFPGPGAVIRRRGFELVGGRNLDYKYIGDFEFWLRLGLHGPFARIPKVLATWRFHAGGATTAAKGAVMAEEHVRVMDELFARPEVPAEVRRRRREAYAAGYYIAAVQCLNDEKLARAYFRKSLLSHWRCQPNGLKRDFKLMGKYLWPWLAKLKGG